MAKKTKKQPAKTRQTAAAELLEALSSATPTYRAASLSEKFRRSGSEKVRLIRSVEKLARKQGVTLDGDRLGEFLVLFSSVGFTAKSFVAFVELSFTLTGSLSRPSTRTNAETALLTVLIDQCAKPPRGFGMLEVGTVARIVGAKTISPEAVVGAIHCRLETKKAAGERIPWLTEAVCGLVNQKKPIDVDQADALIASLLDFPQQGISLSPLVVSVALLCSVSSTRIGKPPTLPADDIPDVFAPITAVYDDATVSLSVNRLKEELSNRNNEIIELEGKIRALKSDVSSRIRESARQDASWKEKLEKLAKELDQSRALIEDLQNENKRQGKFTVEKEKLLTRNFVSELEQKLAKPANDTAILLRRILENAQTDPNEIRRLAINFSKLHKELNRIAETDNSHELTTDIMKKR